MTTAPTPPAVPSPTLTSAPGGLRQRLTTPLAVLVLVPLLVVVTGALTALIGYRQQRALALDLARDLDAERAAQLGRVATSVLGQAEPLLDHWGEVASRLLGNPDPLAWATVLRHLMVARPGVDYVSCSTPDGVFIGMFRDERERLVFTWQDQRDGGRRRDWLPTGDLLVTLKDEHGTGYDPRQRDFWKLATSRPGRVWTDPYVFFASQQTGLSRAEALRSADGGVRAVIAVDFTLAALSRAIRSLALPGDGRLLIHDPAGRVIAAAGALAVADRGKDGTAVVTTLDRVADPRVAAYRSAIAAGVGITPDPVDGGRLLVRQSRLDPAPDVAWTLGTVMPLEPLLAVAEAQTLRSLLATLAVLPLALAIAWAYARAVVRMRAERSAAQQAERVARAEAESLSSYRLERQLGRGGMGEVWLAHHRLLARPAALKLIRRDRGFGDDQVARFEREARATARLRSPHVVTVYDFGQLDDGTLYYAMELLEGADLHALVAKEGPLPAAQVVDLLLQACAALEEAHAAGLIHRDIKPSNLMLCRMGVHQDFLKVLDFGLVISIAGADDDGPRLTGAGLTQGTSGYMAPEQLTGLGFDHRVDIYALGCVAWFLLTGEDVFPGKDAMAIALRHLNEPLPDLASKIPGSAHPGLCALVRDCLAKHADERLATIAILRQRLVALGLQRVAVTTSTALASEVPGAAAGTVRQVRIRTRRD